MILKFKLVNFGLNIYLGPTFENLSKHFDFCVTRLPTSINTDSKNLQPNNKVSFLFSFRMIR